MAGKSSREKGIRGENEVVALLEEAGYHCERRGSGYSGDDLRIVEFPNWYAEVRRQETLCIPGWCREIEEKAGTKVPILFFRRSREPWRVCMTLETFLGLMEG